ncbi:nucleopolyhedrovirus P10 family protein [Streptomyces sp. WAC 01420]|nr:nucleopolyhedrovirus P10 family protein [Streptomyces sp. WAC 01438]RSM99280.1 nucleopolyhedrovirus P10 family protein [Streptomyces sp. WAC 01420]
MRQAGGVTADGWTQAVRQQVGLGRIVPLGGPRDGAWIAERAATVPLRRAAARGAPGVRLDGVRIGLAVPEEAGEPVVPPPPSALPPGPLRLSARFAATAAQPLPVTASLLRTVLADAAERIGLVVAEVDLRVTELLDTDPAVPPDAPEPEPEPAAGQRLPGDSEAGRVAAAVLAVPGVSRLTGTPAGPVRLYASGQPGGTALPHRHARVDLAVRADHHPLEVARAVRAAVTASLPDHPTATVLVTALD